MKPTQLILRCYAHKLDNQWEAFCIDLCLASQAESYEAAKKKLDEQIMAYVHEALTVDREYAAQLLSRKAPLKQMFTYHLYNTLKHVGMARNGIHKLFTEALPLLPQTPRHA